MSSSSAESTDVLIVGAGGAGLRCASEILENRPGTNIVAVTKVPNPTELIGSLLTEGYQAIKNKAKELMDQ